MHTPLDTGFHDQMISIYRRARTECDYNAVRFLQMVNELGGLEAARRLLRSDELSEGLTRLWQEGRLDISMEAVIITQPWRSLFTEEEISIAERRLHQLGFPTGIG